MLQENDDMEELLRKAAENYPLRTDNADWEKVRLALAAEGRSISPVKNKNYRFTWLLLLLLPLGWAAYHYFISPQTVNKTTAGQQIPDGDKKSLGASTGSNQVTSQKNTESEPEQNADQVTQTNTQQGSEASTTGEKNNKKVVLSGKTFVAITQSSPEQTGEVSEHNNNPVNEKTALSKNTPAFKTDNGIKKEENTNDKVSAKENGTVATIEHIKQDKNITEEIKQEKIAGKENKSKTQKTKNHFLYTGVMIAPDFSTIKFQSVKSIGVNKGIITGFRFNKKLAIETGVMWDKKFYYSNGEYFNTGKIYLPPNAKITDVTGNCKMLEIPLNVKYDLKKSEKGNWFAAAGLSSYFMKEENYSYTIVSSGAPYPYKKSYKQSSKYLLSVVNISAGYERSLGKVGTLRIEPYVKLPLKGVGIGSLPITSAGVNLGITRKLF